MVYVTKDEAHKILLWNNKPRYNREMKCFYALFPNEKFRTEQPIDVSGNQQFCDLFPAWRGVPCLMELFIDDYTQLDIE